MEKNFNDFLFKGMYEIPPEYIKIILKFMLHENILDKYMKNVGMHMSYILKNTWSRPLLPRKFQSYEMCNFFNYTAFLTYLQPFGIIQKSKRYFFTVFMGQFCFQPNPSLF